VRELYVEGGGTPALVAVHQDATGKAKALALSYGSAIGVGRAASSRRRSRGDRDGPRSASRPFSAVARARSSRRASTFLVEAGYQPEVAYFECLHELKLIVDLMYRGGLNYMRYSVE
jgi:ketol-acid reductoisomerase